MSHLSLAKISHFWRSPRYLTQRLTAGLNVTKDTPWPFWRRKGWAHSQWGWGGSALTLPRVCVPVLHAPQDRREIFHDNLSVAISTIHTNVKEPFSDRSMPESQNHQKKAWSDLKYSFRQDQEGGETEQIRVWGTLLMACHNIDLNYGISPPLIWNPRIFTVGVFSTGQK